MIMSLLGHCVGILASTAFKDSKVAISMTPMLITPLALFGGLYSNRKLYRNWVGWLEYLSPFKYAFEAGLRN